MGAVLYKFHFDWANNISLLIPLVVGLGFFFIFKWYPAQNPRVNQKGTEGYVGYVFAKWVGWIVGIFTICLFVLLLISCIIDYQDKKVILANDQALVVEGYVEKYHAMPREGHDVEHFEIDGVYFEYSNFALVNGYNQPACYGGVINENGQHLRIKYTVEDDGSNVILYIEDIG